MLQRVAPDGLGCGLGDIWNFMQDNGGFPYGTGFVQCIVKVVLTRAVPTNLFSISGGLPVMYLLSLYKWYLPVRK